eukprot:TRINITY_DN6473_c0_g1_i9.p1 TRINITY_DN6473_c0_g1~~TRINITY_DN6473_c0_g1_i9.p1  ORF type:complete len:113 (-),score=5.10 TRINITY_DN6473_c0_g1_i9:610-948(-)
MVALNNDRADVRIKTVGIYETLISAKGKTIILVDVGGQKSERRKWMKYFQQSLSTIIFCVAVNEFNMQVEEEPTVNRYRPDVSWVWRAGRAGKVGTRGLCIHPERILDFSKQ